MEKDSTMKLSSVTLQTILISTILSGYVPAYKVQSWISSHIRKSTMDMFPQRELSKKGKWKLSFDSYEFLSKHERNGHGKHHKYQSCRYDIRLKDCGNGNAETGSWCNIQYEGFRFKQHGPAKNNIVRYD